MAVLNLLNQPGERFEEEKEYLYWVKDYRSLIRELALINEIINNIQFMLKTEALSKQTAQKTKEILNQCQTKRLKGFKDVISEYMV